MKAWNDAIWLGTMQFLSWGLATISFRAVAQANIFASIVTDTLLGTLQFFVFKRIAKGKDDESLIPWLGYTIGGVIGTVAGIYASLLWLGQ